MNPRLEALHRLEPSAARDGAGLHRFDGAVADLSPAGVASALSGLGGGPREPDAHDEEHLALAERAARHLWGELEIHRWNPLPHLGNLDVVGYEREYAPEADRASARRRHLEAWPDAVSASLESLDRVPAPVARALCGAARGLADGLSGGGGSGGGGSG
ncbi:MAG: DUF885 family protein, partial [Acidimicrobiales bacterium]